MKTGGRETAGWRPWWLQGLSGLVCIGLAAHVAAVLAWLALAPATPWQRTVVSDLAFLPLGLAAASLAWLAARRAGDRVTRRAWRSLAGAFGAWWVGDALWCYFELVRRTSPFPSAADLAYLAFYVLAVSGLLGFRDAGRSRGERFTLGLDAATVVVGAAMIVWYLVVEPQSHVVAAGIAPALLSASYPVADVVVFFAVALVLLGRRERRPLSLRILMAGVTLVAVADVGFAHLFLRGSYRGGDWPDGLWLVALLLLVASAQVQCRAGTSDPSPPRPAFRPRVSLLPYAVMGAAYSLALAVALGQAGSPLGGLLLGSATLTAVVVLRQVTALNENARLLSEMRLLAGTDPLTGLSNRRSFMASAELEIDRSGRYGGTLAAVMVDIDNFKAINDAHGHDVGDRVLVAVAEVCRDQCRSFDLVGRYGGDEIVILLLETATDRGESCAQRLLHHIGAVAVPSATGPVAVGASLGVASHLRGEELVQLLRRADEALYEAKKAGRGCVRAHRGGAQPSLPAPAPVR